jgi:hypothetical protein
MINACRPATAHGPQGDMDPVTSTPVPFPQVTSPAPRLVNQRRHHGRPIAYLIVIVFADDRLKAVSVPPG